jgi:hypothetical protein
MLVGLPHHTGDISSNDGSDEDEDMVPKPVENVENTRNTGKRKCTMLS